MKKQFYRVKQLADQTFSRSGKSEALTDELQNADRKVEHLRNALQLISKRLSTGAGNTQGQDPAAREKRLKKLPEYMLGLSMLEASNFDDDDGILKYILHECGKTEKFLANEIAEHELKVEQLVCSPLTTIADNDLPAIMKAKKQLSRLINEKESAASRYHHLERQKEENPTKLSAAREELEEAGMKVESARDALAADMFALVAKEAQLAHTLLQYVKLQRAYHESALHSLQDTVPELERFINDSAVKPVFGYPLEEHLRVTGRTIAFPIELCVCTLHELALNEEGLFRIAGGSSKVRRMKLSLNAGLFSLPLPRDYRDPHVVAGVLKSYLRELPEPLLTSRLHDAFLAAARLQAEPARLQALWDAVHRLPEANFHNLRYLVKFLAVLTQSQAANRMSPSNLAIVMAPNLLWAGDDAALDMHLAAAGNCAVELLIKHADWFYSEPLHFFISFTKEDLLPDQCEYGFTPSFGPGFAQTAALQDAATNGDAGMARSMLECGAPDAGGAGSAGSAGRHSRSNSHDTALILVEDGLRAARSSSSLSEQSSPPPGSPRPVLRRKNKPAAPAPPVLPAATPAVPAAAPAATPDRAKKVDGQSQTSAPEVELSRTPNVFRLDPEKPAKPPRPLVNDSGKIISGVQTINRSTYRQNRALKEEALRSGSRENLTEPRRQSLDFLEKERAEKAAQTVRPVAAPRTSIAPLATGEDSGDVFLRAKPAVPERPAALRPHSFRALRSDGTDALLERTHIYCDRQQPTLVTLAGSSVGVAGSGAGAAGSGAGGADDAVTVQRTHSSGGKDAAEEVAGALAASRQLSQSEGSITEGAAPRPRPPRPQMPAPPPPASPAPAPRPQVDSTDL